MSLSLLLVNRVDNMDVAANGIFLFILFSCFCDVSFCFETGNAYLRLWFNAFGDEEKVYLFLNDERGMNEVR